MPPAAGHHLQGSFVLHWQDHFTFVSQAVEQTSKRYLVDWGRGSGGGGGESVFPASSFLYIVQYGQENGRVY